MFKGLTHMHITRSLGIGLLVAAAAMTGCKNKQKSEMSMLEEENATLRNQLAERTKTLEDTNAEKRSLEQQLAALRKDAKDPTGSTNTEGGTFTRDGVQWSAGAGEVTASIQGDVLFDSGKTTLKSTAKKSLDSVASILKGEYAGKSIRVSGFTDTDPLKRSGYKSNYHLGFE